MTAQRVAAETPSSGTKIVRVSATPLLVPIRIEAGGAARDTSLSVCLTEIETADGMIGHGFTGITEEEVIAEVIDEIVEPALIGEDALAHERIWNKLYWLLTPRGQTGYASHAISAIDIALWDIKGKTFGQPVWRLLGGARERVPVYTTFGFAFLDREALVAAAREWVGKGHKRLKMTVGAEALQRRDAPRPQAEVIAEDVRRIFAVREAVGPDVELFIDANCSLDPYHALRLAREVESARIGFFEEPITQNDVRRMADLRRQAPLPLAAGQNEGQSFRFRDLLVNDACAWREWRPRSMFRSPMEAPGPSTTCICMPASHMADWWSTTIRRCCCAGRSSVACRSPTTGISRCRIHRAWASRPMPAPSAISHETELPMGGARVDADASRCTGQQRRHRPRSPAPRIFGEGALLGAVRIESG